jgi:hypothetical protein
MVIETANQKNVKSVTSTIMINAIIGILGFICCQDVVHAYILNTNNNGLRWTKWPSFSQYHGSHNTCVRTCGPVHMTAGKGFGTSSSSVQPSSSSILSSPPKEKQDLETLTCAELKDRLMLLLSRTTGKKDDNAEISAIVNMLESKYKPVETLDFFNIATGASDWQLMFSTNRLGTPDAKLRLRELVQRIEPDPTDSKRGKITNMASWIFANNGINYDMFGTMSINNEYTINNQGAARMQISLRDHVIELGKGSKAHKSVVNDVPNLLRLIHKAMPTELFDPNHLGMDTTYLDSDFRIVRFTTMGNDQLEGLQFDEDGNLLEKSYAQENTEDHISLEEKKRLFMLNGVRNIFIKKGSKTIKPVLH